jgi:hypothetical protein
MPRKRPTAVLVIAIFHFIFAACGGISGVMQLSGAAAGLGKMGGAGDPKAAKMQEDMERAIAAKFPAHKTFEKVEAGVALLIAILLLVAGIGLLNMQPWGRGLSILYAVLAIANTLVNMFIIFAYVNPATQAALKEIPNMPPEMASAMQVGTVIVFAGLGCLGLLYPIIVLIIMLLPNVSRAFRAPEVSYAEGAPDERDEDDYERRERWRE